MDLNAATLNPYVLSYIFQYLNVQDLRAARRVCQGWKNQLTDISYWKRVKLVVNYKNINNSIEWEIIRLCDSIKINTSHLRKDQVQEFVNKIYPKMFVNISIEGSCKKCLEHCTKTRQLRKDEVAMLGELASIVTHVEHLTITNLPKGQMNDMINSLAQKIYQSRIRKLSLENASLHSCDLNNLSSIISKVPHVNLKGMKMDNVKVRKLLQTVGNETATELKTLELENIDIGVIYRRLSWRFLGNLTATLSSIDLSNTELPYTACEVLFRELQWNRELKYLRICRVYGVRAVSYKLLTEGIRWRETVILIEANEVGEHEDASLSAVMSSELEKWVTKEKGNHQIKRINLWYDEKIKRRTLDGYPEKIEGIEIDYIPIGDLTFLL